MRKTSPFATFTPCETCEAKEILDDSGSILRTDFGFALKELKRREDSYDDSGRTVPVSTEDILQVAGMCDLDGYVGPLTKCYAAKLSKLCTADQVSVVNVEVNNAIL